MNTLEILYQAFKVRYSLSQLQQILDRGCRLALIGAPSAHESILRHFGEPIPGLEEEGREGDLILLDPNLSEKEVRELKTCDACLVLFEGEPPSREELEELASKVPLHVKSLWLLLDPLPGIESVLYEDELTAPTVRALPPGKEEKRFLSLFQAALPQISLIMARNYAGLRTEFCKTLTRRTAIRNGVRSGLASLPLKSIPGIGRALSFLAISAETLMLTASQLRLSFVIAAVHGRPLDFFDRINELWPIIGSAFGFRALSRYFVKSFPKVGGGAKATIAFSGTYAVGEASRLYYELGRPTSDEVRRELLRLSRAEGAREAQRLFRRVMAGQPIDDEGAELEEVVEELTSVSDRSEGDAGPGPTAAAPSDSPESSTTEAESQAPSAEPEVPSEIAEEAASGDATLEPTLEMKAVEPSDRSRLKSALQGMSEPAGEVQVESKGESQEPSEDAGEPEASPPTEEPESAPKATKADAGEVAEPKVAEAEVAAEEPPKKKRARKRNSARSKSDKKDEKS